MNTIREETQSQEHDSSQSTVSQDLNHNSRHNNHENGNASREASAVDPFSEDSAPMSVDREDSWGDIQKSGHSDMTNPRRNTQNGEKLDTTNDSDGDDNDEQPFKIMPWGNESQPAFLDAFEDEEEDRRLYRGRNAQQRHRQRKSSRTYNTPTQQQQKCCRFERRSNNFLYAISCIFGQVAIATVLIVVLLPKFNDRGVNSSVVRTWNDQPNGDNVTEQTNTTNPPLTDVPSQFFDLAPSPSAMSVSISTAPSQSPTSSVTIINGEVYQPTKASEELTTLAPTSATTTSITAPPSSALPTTVTFTTSVPTITPVTESIFFEWLPPQTQTTISQDTWRTTPQARAFYWMVADPDFAVSTKGRVLQRYALAVLYYALGGPEWTIQQGWLNYNLNECTDWAQAVSNSSNSPLFYDSGTVCRGDDDEDESNEIQKLLLPNNNLQGSLPLEISLLTSVEVLDLSQNSGLKGTLPAEVFSAWPQLQQLLVYECQLTGTIPTELLISLEQLRGFHAWDNFLTGTVFSSDITSTPPAINTDSRLQQWHVGNNLLQGSLSSDFILSTSTSLESLWVYGNQLTGTLPTELGLWSGQLTSLLAWGNRMTGSLPTQLGSLSRLQRLSLEDNAIAGPIPSQLGNLGPSLQGLWLSSNALSGSVPSSISELRGLLTLSLHNNSLTGPIMTELGLMTNLMQLTLYDNLLTGTIPSQVGNLRSLRNFRIHNNMGISGTIPTQIGRLSKLESLYLMRNRLTGPIPPGMLERLTNLEFCFLQNNQLRGTLPTSLAWSALTRLQSFSVSQNNLGGPIGSELGLLTSLKLLDLSLNQFTSTIPSEIGELVVGGNLEQLRLFWNELSGSIPSSLFPPLLGSTSGGASGRSSHSVLRELSLEGNQLTGTLDVGIGGLSHMEDFWVSQNRLVGSIPTEVGLMGSQSSSSLLNIALWDNELEGRIPTELGLLSDRLVLFDAEENRLTSILPTELGQLSVLESLVLNSNELIWVLPTELGRMESLEILELSDNKLAGSIPRQIGRLSSSLQVLHLDGNSYLFGSIPTEQLSQLTNLRELTLNGTLLTGSIPEELCDVSVLHVDCADIDGGSSAVWGLCGCQCLDCSLLR